MHTVTHASTSETCPHHLGDHPTGLRCTRKPHAGNGHVYHDSAGSAVADRHLDGGQTAEPHLNARTEGRP